MSICLSPSLVVSLPCSLFLSFSLSLFHHTHPIWHQHHTLTFCLSWAYFVRPSSTLPLSLSLSPPPPLSLSLSFLSPLFHRSSIALPSLCQQFTSSLYFCCFHLHKCLHFGFEGVPSSGILFLPLLTAARAVPFFLPPQNVADTQRYAHHGGQPPK